MKQTYTKNLLILAACTALTACGSTADRIANIGNPPQMSSIDNPTLQKDYQPVSLPMPAPQNVIKEKNSLWASDRQTFFKDQRAAQVGDLITVVMEMKDKAELDNETERTRESSEGAGLNSLLGYEQALDQVLPEAVDNTSLV